MLICLNGLGILNLIAGHIAEGAWGCTQSPYVHCMPWHAQYGRWNFLRDMGGVHEIGYKSSLFFICLFASEEKNVCLLINYQSCNLLLSFELKNRILETNSHFTQELFLCFRWPHYEHLRLHSLFTWLPTFSPLGQNENFFLLVYFFVLGWRFACFRLLPFIVCYITNTSCFPTPFRNQLNRLYFPLSDARRVLNSKISRTFLPPFP